VARGARDAASDEIAAGYVVNTGGLQADRVAREFGFSAHYRVVPFRGAYLYGDQGEQLRTHLYPVPDSRFAFLGVHFTVTVAGQVKIGPTAMPGLWREQYGGFAGFEFRDAIEVGGEVMALLRRGGAPFRRHAFAEVRKLSRRHLVGLAGRLAADVAPEHYTRWGRPGIRAQLVDRRTGQLENDFVLEGDATSMHVLNAVSPAFTCALPFAAHVVDRIEAACR
jgi:L-2-hydroxyglutarate oxidase LhgO